MRRSTTSAGISSCGQPWRQPDRLAEHRAQLRAEPPHPDDRRLLGHFARAHQHRAERQWTGRRRHHDPRRRQGGATPTRRPIRSPTSIPAPSRTPRCITGRPTCAPTWTTPCRSTTPTRPGATRRSGSQIDAARSGSVSPAPCRRISSTPPSTSPAHPRRSPGRIRAPTPTRPEKLDDLAHAAVNGRGRFFNTSRPDTFSEQMRLMLADIAAGRRAPRQPRQCQPERRDRRQRHLRDELRPR